MPDFERILDSLRVEVAKSPAEKSFEQGFIAGKNQARYEIAAISCAVALGVALYHLLKPVIGF